jgi:uncharacterized protein (DUF362 family)
VTDERMTDEQRRRFLKQAAAAGAISAGAGYLALAPEDWPLSLSDLTGENGKPVETVLKLPEGGYAVEASASAADLGVARGADIPAMVRAATDAVGGPARFINRGDVVVIKPNVAFERAPQLGATTNPEVLKAVIHLCREAGAAEVRVCDNPIESPEAAFARSGIRQASIDAGARVYLPGPSDFTQLNTPGAKHIEKWPFFWRPFLGADKVIGVSPVKDHNLCRASMTTKNWYGLLGGRRNQFHQDIHGIITDLALMMRPTLVFLDGTRVLYRSGPTGGSLSDVKEGRTIVAATDMLAADAFGWHDLLERGSEELPAYFAQSAEKKLGNPDYKSLKLKEVRVG